MIPLRSSFHFLETHSAVFIYDTSPGTHKMTVTNDAENVIASLVSSGINLADKLVFYFDSQGRLDQMLVINNKFAGFAPVGDLETVFRELTE